jgi:hypothetical protein
MGASVLGMAAFVSCIPNPEKDFDDYVARAPAPAQAAADASTFDAAPPTESVEGLYYGGCKTELVPGINKRFSFYTRTKFTPSASGGSLELSVQPLAVEGKPASAPAVVSSAGLVGQVIQVPASPVAATGRFRLELGVITFPGSANPISGSDVEIQNTVFDGRFAKERFCARLSGNLVKPQAAARTLDATLNICQFVAIKDGDKMPAFTDGDFVAGACPTE